MNCITSNSVLTFGKYVGYTAIWVARNDPNYMLWIANSTNYNVTPRLIRVARRNLNPTPQVVVHHHHYH